MAKTPKVEEKVKNWMSQIELGLRAREKFSTVKHWPEYRRRYRGDFGNRKIFLNISYSTGKTLIPRVYFKVPRIAVTPTRPEFAGHARVVEALDNWLIRETMLKQTLKKSGYDGYSCGTGVVKLGYDSEFGYVPSKATEPNMGSVTQVGERTGRQIEYDVNIKPGMPWAIRTFPEDVIVPFGYDDPNRLPWVCFTHMRPLADVKEDWKYNKNKFDLKGGLIPRVVRDGLLIHREDSLYRRSEPYVLLYEIHDAAYRKIITIAEDQILLEDVDELQIEGLPVEFIRFNEDLEFFWGISDIQILEPQQIEANEIKAMVAKLRRYNVIKFLFQKGVIEMEELNTLLSTDIEDIGAGIPLNTDSVASAIHALQPHGLTRELESDKQDVLSDVRESIGMSRNTQGEYIPMTSKTATEAKLVDSGVSVRIDDRRDHMADVLTNIMRKFNQFCFKFWDKKKVIQVTGLDGARYWVEYTGADLVGEYALTIDPEAGQPISRELKYNLSKELFSELRNDPLINQVELRKQLLRQYDWIDPEASLLVQQAPPVQNGPANVGNLPQGVGGSPEKAMDLQQFSDRQLPFRRMR